MVIFCKTKWYVFTGCRRSLKIKMVCSYWLWFFFGKMGCFYWLWVFFWKIGCFDWLWSFFDKQNRTFSLTWWVFEKQNATFLLVVTVLWKSKESQIEILLINFFPFNRESSKHRSYSRVQMISAFLSHVKTLGYVSISAMFLVLPLLFLISISSRSSSYEEYCQLL